MKTAISIPDELHESIEAFLERAEMTRSEFFQRAARLYLDKFAARAITANLDRIYADPDAAPDRAFRQAAVSHFSELTGDDDW